MINDYDSAVWADHHARVGEDIRRLVTGVMEAFRALYAIRFTAPWRGAV